MSLEIPLAASSAGAETRTRARTTGAERRGHMAGLIWTLVRTDVKVYYHGSLAGFAWALLRPLSMFTALTLIFALVFASQPNFAVNLLIGLFLYEFFSEGTRAGLTSLYRKGYLLTKTQFPYWIVIPTASVNAIIILAVFSTATLSYLAVTGRPPGAVELAAFAFYVTQMWVLILGISLGMSALYLRFRDLIHIWDAVLQAGFFVAPIIITIDMLPESVRSYLFLWPPTPVIVFSRQVLVEGTLPSLSAHLYLLGLTTFVLLGGVFVFRRFARGAAEQL